MKPLAACTVLVTPTSFARYDRRILATLAEAVGETIGNDKGRPLTSEELRAILPRCDAYIAGLDYIDAEALSNARRLRVIARYGAGVDRVDLAAAQARGIIVTNTPGANAAAVAELAIGLMLALARHITLANATTRRGEWRRYAGISLQGKTVGLLGFGAIGREVARRLSGFDCQLLAHDPYVTAADAASLGVELAARDKLLATADMLSLHVPVSPDTYGLVDADFLSAMKGGAYLINTARGELIDEDALIAALASGQIAGAALDVFSMEPPPGDHPLFDFPQVIATPHMGAGTDGAANAMGWGALHDCLAVLRGEAPRHRVV